MKLIRKYFFTTVFKKRIKRGSPFKDSLYRKISYVFSNDELVEQALTHRSSVGHSKLESNERLEFLGDSVLGLIVTEQLYKRYPDKNEGELTKAKSSIVSGSTLAYWADKIDLGTFLKLGRGEEQSGGRKRKSLLADAFEALVGAMYLDGGIEPVRDFICSTVLVNSEKYLDYRYRGNFKSRLLEFVQAKAWEGPDYEVIGDEGPDHDKKFIVEVSVNREPMGRGNGKSKKEAEQSAAMEALKYLNIF